MGNILFFDYSLEFLESFLVDIERYYELEVLVIDFQDQVIVSRQINEYFKNKIQGKIADLFLESDSLVMFILVNYIFFKGILYLFYFDKVLFIIVKNSSSYLNLGCIFG